MTLDGLFKTLTGIDRRLRFLNTGSGVSLDTGNTWHDIAAREALHRAILDLKATDAFKALIGKVTLVTPATDSDSARADFCQFLALINLTPFAFKLTDAAALAALKNANPSLAQAWEADAGLSAAHRAAGLGHYSDLWLADRAAMLSWMLNANRDDQTSIKSAKVGDEAWSFRDVDSGGSVLVLPEKPLSSTAPRHYVTFGGSGDDALSGAELADHLYGGDGDDTLTGNSGADVLEGGKGKDTYIVTSSGSGDIITDSDGQGGVQWLIGGTRHTLTGGKQVSNGTWRSDDGKFVYTLVLNSAGGSDLKVLADGGQLFIRNFTSGQLGITLATGAPKVAGVGTAGHDNLSSSPVTEASGLAGNDLFYGAAGDVAEWVDGGADRDVLLGRGGNDTLLGGAGDDFIVGGNGSDLIVCGDGNDMNLAGTVYLDENGVRIESNDIGSNGVWVGYAQYWDVTYPSGSNPGPLHLLVIRTPAYSNNID